MRLPENEKSLIWIDHIQYASSSVSVVMERIQELMQQNQSLKNKRNGYFASLCRDMRKGYQNYLLMAPYLLFFAVFTVLPVLVAVIMSFTDFNMLQIPSFVGWNNYLRMLLQDDIFLIALKNTLIFALITGPIGYLMCFLLAWMINDFQPKLRAVITVVFYAPALDGNAFIAWKYLFSSDQYGIINAFLMQMGVIDEAIGWLTDSRYIMGVLIVVQLWLSLGAGFLSFIAGLQGVDRSLYEAAAVDGIRNRFQELWYVTLPSMAPQLLFGAVMQIVSAFSVADVSIQLAGFPSSEYVGETIVTHILDYGNIRYELGYACAMAAFLFLLMYFSKRCVGFLLKNVGK